MDNNRPVFTVSDINQYIKALLNKDENLKFIYVKGEISNFKMASNGHFYFSLKDDKAMISAMMFSSYASKNTFVPENGQEVVVFGSIDAYPGRGTYQIIVYSMQEVGAGQALLELEKLKKKLKYTTHPRIVVHMSIHIDTNVAYVFDIASVDVTSEQTVNAYNKEQKVQYESGATRSTFRSEGALRFRKTS